MRILNGDLTAYAATAVSNNGIPSLMSTPGTKKLWEILYFQERIFDEMIAAPAAGAADP